MKELFLRTGFAYKTSHQSRVRMVCRKNKKMYTTKT